MHGLRIVQLLGGYPPDPIGGTEVYVAALSRRLIDAGHDVSVAAPRAGAARAVEEKSAGVPVLRYPVPRDATRDEAQGRLIARGAEALHRHLERLRPDVVHFHTLTTGLGLGELRAARAVGARRFVTFHESSLGFLCRRGTLLRYGEGPCDGLVAPGKCAACALDARGLPRPLARAAAQVPATVGRLVARAPGRLATALGMSGLVARDLLRQRELLSLVERAIVLTETARRIVLANGAPPAKVALNRLGVDGETRAPRPRSRHGGPLRVGFLGRYDAVKGAEVLVEAARRIAPDVPISVELRGPLQADDARARAERLRRRAAGDARVRVGDGVPRDEVAATLAGWDLLCCPSLCAEGGPTVALEAFAVGTPVVGSRIGGLAELVDPRWGALVEPGDAAALAHLLTRLARAPATVEDWRAALPAARTMDDVARDYLSLYAGDRSTGAAA